MKILFVVEIQNIQHKEQSELILDSLKSLSYSAEVWEIGDNYFLKTDFFCFSNPESLNEKSYDLVVAFNKNALKNINEY